MASDQPEQTKADILHSRIVDAAARAIKDAGDDMECHAAVTEALASCLGRYIAFVCGGNQKVMGDMLEGALHHVEVCASDTQAIAHFLAQAKQAASGKRAPG